MYVKCTKNICVAIVILYNVTTCYILYIYNCILYTRLYDINVYSTALCNSYCTMVCYNVI